jgi:hypothetical protein
VQKKAELLKITFGRIVLSGIPLNKPKLPPKIIPSTPEENDKKINNFN